MAVWMLAALGFVVGGALATGLYLLIVRLPGLLARRRLESRLAEVGQTAGDPEQKRSSFIKTHRSGPLPAVDRLVSQSKQGGQLALWIEQAGIRTSASAILLLGLLSAVACATAARLLFNVPWAPLAGLAVGVVVPAAVVHRRRVARLRRFEEQFPEALDLIGRAVRAGHAFTTGLKMVADEVEDPVGPEFRKTFDEQNFGLPLKDALGNLCERVPSLDVRFFATAVLIQRETGGNLAEVLENLSHVVRERFKILRQVRVHTAHGRLTGYVLLALPAALALVLSFINPEHMNLLFRERIGQILLGIAVLMQIAGYFWIQRVVKIEV